MDFFCDGRTVACSPAHLVVAGWTGRDADAVRHHIEELAALGVPPPSTVPLFYRCAPSLLTQAPRIAVLGGDSSGEAEPLVLIAGGRRYLGLGSDHTDRKLESVSVAASKQVCAKPVAAELWAWDAIAGHLDAITLEADIDEGGGWVAYQRGSLAAIRPLETLVAAAGLGALARDGDAAMLCGTLAAIGGVRPASRIRMALHDPRRNRTIRLEYRADALPVIA